jgi:protein-L-isoaspartate(D-aspartate) O-methyltransferase
MVNEQLIPRGIKDKRVLDAFRKVPRHRFLPRELINSAYADHPLPIGEGQTISQPYIVALMTECLRLLGEERILEIGTGSGYQAAILAELAKEVYSVERIANLAQNAIKILDELKVTNVKIKVGDGTMGWEEFSPFEGIIVTAGAPDIPFPLIEQLKENGKIIIPLGGTFSQVLTLVEKINPALARKGGIKGKIKTTDICGCVFVPLMGKYGWSE